MIGPAPACLSCRYFHRDSEKPVCDAFPNGIPDRIFWGGFDHKQPFEGDNDIRFEPNLMDKE